MGVPRGKPFAKGDNRINREGRTVKGAGKTKYNKLTNEQRKALANEAGGITPLEILHSIMRAEDAPLGIKLEAVKIAIPYIHRKMPQAFDGGEGKPLIPIDASVLAKMSEKDIAELHKRMTLLNTLSMMPGEDKD